MIIVNVATGAYKILQQRLKASLNGHKTLLFDDFPDKNRTHKESPYEFKIHAIEKAFEKDDVVLWVDASMWLVGDINKIQSIVETDGYFMEEAGHYVRDWCQDKTLDYFGLTRDTNFIMFSAGLLGLNKKSEIAMRWFDKWKQSAKAGHFRGDWSEHRHDMTCGSIIAQQMGMKYQSGGTHMAYIGPGYSDPKNSVVFYCQGL